MWEEEGGQGSACDDWCDAWRVSKADQVEQLGNGEQDVEICKVVQLSIRRLAEMQRYEVCQECDGVAIPAGPTRTRVPESLRTRDATSAASVASAPTSNSSSKREVSTSCSARLWSLRWSARLSWCSRYLPTD